MREDGGAEQHIPYLFTIVVDGQLSWTVKYGNNRSSPGSCLEIRE